MTQVAILLHIILAALYARTLALQIPQQNLSRTEHMETNKIISNSLRRVKRLFLIQSINKYRQQKLRMFQHYIFFRLILIMTASRFIKTINRSKVSTSLHFNSINLTMAPNLRLAKFSQRIHFWVKKIDSDAIILSSTTPGNGIRTTSSR